MQVTDIVRTFKDGSKKTGFYMDGYLAENLSPIPKYLDAAWDCVGIISGRGKVRIGKSTHAAQVAYYIAWLIAGGEMDFENKIVGKKPTKDIVFNLEDNYAFSAAEMQEKATRLYEKYGKGQVLVYDEGRQGLDSARTMENVNKGMEDFFQECGFMGHVILIVLPNFFKLHEDYAVARSLFLIDVFAKDGIQRGFFNFYNEKQKEWLYYLGKKKIGVSQKYTATWPSFWGRFTAWLPFDKVQYESMKKRAIEKKRKTRMEKNFMMQRDFFVWYVSTTYGITLKKISHEFERVLDTKIAVSTLEDAKGRITNLIATKKGY